MKRINCIINDSEFLDCLKKNQAAEEQRIYCRHDMNHFLDVARIAYILTLEDKMNIDKDTVYAASLLHDIGRWMEYGKKIDHADAGAVIAENILKRCGFTENETASIISAIESHRNKENSSALGSILFRADKLSRNCTYCESRDTCKHFMKGEKPFLLY
jgi:putative nucleotidyltransferase with HDIG domain